jgi:hypothetical protein
MSQDISPVSIFPNPKDAQVALKAIILELPDGDGKITSELLMSNPGSSINMTGALEQVVNDHVARAVDSQVPASQDADVLVSMVTTLVVLLIRWVTIRFMGRAK